MRLLLPALAVLAAACGAPKATGGTAQLRFAAADMVKNSSSLVDPLKGTFYGAVFLQEDVTVTGPRNDAMELQGLELANVDLTMKGPGEASDASLVTKMLPAGKYVVLGFLDVDGSSAAEADRRPEAGDPSTLALTNKFDITDGAETKRLILLEIVIN